MSSYLNSHSSTSDSTPDSRPDSTSGRSRAVVVTALSALVALAALVLPVGAASAAGSDGADGNTPPGKAWVRAGNFVPSMGGVSIQLDPRSSGAGMTLAQRVSYGKVTQYRQIAPGTYTVSVRPEGASAKSRPMLRRSLSVSAGKASTIALLGTQDAPRLATLSDDLTPPKAGTARVRVLSGSSDTSALSIKAVDGPQIASDVVLGETTGYASVPKGRWTLALDDGAMDTVRKTVDLASGGVYTAVVLDGDETSAGKVRLALVTDAQGVAQTPKGAAATGLGGTAAGSSFPVGVLAVAGFGMALFATGSFGVRRVSRRAAVER